MDDKAARALAGAMASLASGGDPAMAAPVTARLAGLSGRDWLRLDESARRTYWGESALDRVGDWRPALTAADGTSADGTTAEWVTTDGTTAEWVTAEWVTAEWVTAVRIAASMCRDGRVREAATVALAGMPGPLAAAALALRTADWVPAVSAVAMAGVSARAGDAAGGVSARAGDAAGGVSGRPGDAAAIVPVMLALRQRRRGQPAADVCLAGLAEGPAATLTALSAAGERATRRWAREALAGRGLLAAEALTARALRDRDPVIALWCARQLAASSGELPAGAGPRLLRSARAGVRAFAVAHTADDQLTRDALRGLLTDRSGAVWSAARWKWTRQFGDAGPVYLEVLAAGDPPQPVAAALRELDEGNDDSLPAAAVPFLAHRSPAVRRAAVRAVGRHGSADDITGQLTPLLQDPSDKVVTAVLRYLRGYRLPPGVLAALDAAGTPRARRTALAIRQRLGPWARVHADLVAVNGPDPALAQAARTDLLAWLQHDATTTYGRPAAGQAAQIAGLLGTPLLTDQQRRQVAFAAGIPLESRS